MAAMDADDEAPFERASRSQRKREAHAREALGQDLAQFPPALRAALPLPPELQQALAELDHTKERGAHKRQLKYVGRLLREMDDDVFQVIAQGVASSRQEAHQAAAQFNALERWRDLLLQEGDAAVARWCGRYPATDAEALKALVAQARAGQARTPPDPVPRRQLFRKLREWMTAAAGGEAR